MHEYIKKSTISIKFYIFLLKWKNYTIKFIEPSLIELIGWNLEN